METSQLHMLFVVAILLLAGALWLVYYVLRGNERKWPSDAFQWSAVGIAAVVAVAAGSLGVMVLAFAVNPIDFDAGETADVRSGELNAPVADFSFRLVTDDSEMRLSDFAGNVVLVNIWATWCPPCLFEMPELDRLYRNYRGSGLVVLHLSDEERENLLTYEVERPLSTLSAYVDPSTLPEPLQRNFALRPTSFIIDREGILRRSVLGARDYDAFERMIRPHLMQEIAADVG